MQSLRRRLREEMSLDIRLSQPDAVEAMLLACLRSNDQDTRHLGIRLAELSDSASTPPTPQRGPESLAPTITEDGAREPSVRMYRGQRVYA